jgi:hypothetical protein
VLTARLQSNDLAVRRALEAAGVEFIDGNGGGRRAPAEGASGRKTQITGRSGQDQYVERLPRICAPIECGEGPEVSGQAGGGSVASLTMERHLTDEANSWNETSGLGSAENPAATKTAVACPPDTALPRCGPPGK